MRIKRWASAALFAVLAFSAMAAWSVSAAWSASAHPLFLTESGKALLVSGEGGGSILRGTGGSVTCEKSLTDGFVLNKSPLIHRLKISFEGKCELHTAGLQTCAEPIVAHTSLGELGLVLANKTVGILIAPSEGGTELITIKCGVNEIKVNGAVIGEIPAGLNPYNKPLSEIWILFEAVNKSGTKQEVTSIELLGENMSNVHLSTTGFFAGEASEETLDILKGDGKVEICTLAESACP